MTSSVTAFAPATVANLGPGFDILGLALRQPGDRVTATMVDSPGVTIEEIIGDEGALSLDPSKNTAGVAATETLKKAGLDCGVSLRIEKGMGIGTDWEADAAAAAYAVNTLVGSPLRKSESALYGCRSDCLCAHAETAPALLGGLVLVRSRRARRDSFACAFRSLHRHRYAD